MTKAPWRAFQRVRDGINRYDLCESDGEYAVFSLTVDPMLGEDHRVSRLTKYPWPLTREEAVARFRSMAEQLGNLNPPGRVPLSVADITT